MALWGIWEGKLFYFKTTYSGATDRPGELCNNFTTSNNLTPLANPSTWVFDYGVNSLCSTVFPP